MDYAIGSRKWPGLSKLIEEAGEVTQVAGKLLGTNGAAQHWDGSNLRERLVEEMGDMLAAVRFVANHNELDYGAILARETAKYELFCQWHADVLATQVVQK